MREGGAPAQICSVDRAFHHLLDAEDADGELERILEEGLLPASMRPVTSHPDPDRRLEFLKTIHELIAAPVLGRPYTNSGVFLTPIDFRHPAGREIAWRPGLPAARLPRVVVPVADLDPALSVVTWVEEGLRVTMRLGAAALREAAEKWPAPRVAEWFGHDRTKMFFYVPQIACYQGRIPVKRAWFER